MTPIPVTFCLMTTTKGHFGVKTRYLETVESFNAALNLRQYQSCVAHIKRSPGDDSSEMDRNLTTRGFNVYETEGNWAHGQPSHQFEYLKDCLKMLDFIKTPYVFMVEDDWKVKAYDGEFIDYIHRAVLLLDLDPGLMQVRIPRWSNEADRINRLKAKHGLDRSAVNLDEYTFLHNDFSMNPAFYRTRDLRAALIFVMITGLPKHIEHGLGGALAALGSVRTPFACFNPSKIRIGHLGTLPGEEDSLDQPHFAT